MTFERKIFLGAAGFVVFIFSLVYGCLIQDFDLVADNYYEKEINHQDHIEKLKNTNQLNGEVTFTMDATYSSAELKFPTDLKTEGLSKGTITFFRPSDATQDVRLALNVNDDLSQTIATQGLEKGLWKVQVDWESGDTPYYKEFTLIMQ